MPVEPKPPPARRLLKPDAPPHLTVGALAGAAHGFFGRLGGVSSGIYASLNAGAGSKDAPHAIVENRRRVAAAFNQPLEHLIGVHQVHSARCVFVDRPWAGERPEADAMVAKTPGLILSILTADCAPILFWDPDAKVIGAAHAGWKGAHGGVIENTVAMMCAHGAEARSIHAAIGPTIAQASYEVGPEFAARFAPDERDAFFRSGAGDRLHFDLPAYCVARLQRVGVKHIEDCATDTYASAAAFFSHRRSCHENQGDYGRNCAAVMLSQI